MSSAPVFSPVPEARAANLRAAGLMVFSMALFALEDSAIKALSFRLSVGQILATLGALGLGIFWFLLVREGGRMWTRTLLRPIVVLRTLGELIGTLCFVSALALTDLSSVSAILQALPLGLVLAAALFLREPVGWRRWLAILLGFAGVLLIVRPGLAGFQPASLLALVAVGGLVMRDITTRRMPREIASHQLSAAAFGMLVPAGLGLAAVTGTPLLMPSGVENLLTLVAIIVGVGGYATLVTATRVGEASLIAPFRYARLIFNMILAVVLFGERPDALTLAGAAVIVGSGGFAMWRELVRARRL